MKDLFFVSDLLSLFRQDKYYSVVKNVSNALRKFSLPYNEQTENIEQMIRKLAVHLIGQRGETEPFLTERFIDAKALIKLLKEHSLPVPTKLQPESTKQNLCADKIDQIQFEKYFDLVCRNCGTVTDPLGTSYRTPIGRLVFRTYLETLQKQGVKTTAWYILEHLKDFDTEKIVTSVKEDYVTWRTEDAKEKLTSLHTISKFVLRLDREIANILGR